MTECKHEELYICPCCGEIVCFDCGETWKKEQSIPEVFEEAFKDKGDLK